MSDDLISRKALLENLRSRKYIDMPLREGFESIVDWQPTAYDVDKVIEKLESKARGEWGYPSVMEFEDVVNIVKAGGVDE